MTRTNWIVAIAALAFVAIVGIGATIWANADTSTGKTYPGTSDDQFVNYMVNCTDPDTGLPLTGSDTPDGC